MPYRFQLVALLALVGPALAGTNQTIVISAPRLDNLDLMAVDTAADVTVIDRDAIESSAAVSVPELLRSEANLLVRGTSGTPYDGAISMRGFGENAQLRNLVVVDGHKINRPDMGGIEWTQVPLSQIDRIEVVRGGQNVLYGNHALSGVVKITTRRAEKPGVSAGASLGSFGSRSGSLAVQQIYDSVDLHIGYDQFASDGFRSNSASRAVVGHVAAGWYPNETDSLTLRGSLGRSYTQFPGPLSEEDFEKDPTQASQSGEGDGHSEDWSGLATLIYETDREWGAARVTTGFNRRERTADLLGTHTDNDQTGVSVGPRLRYGSDASFGMGGVDLFYDRLDIERYLDEERAITEAWGEFDRLTVSPYLFVQRTFENKHILSGGARYEHAATDHDYVEYEASQLQPFDNRGNPNPLYKNPPDADPNKSFDGKIAKSGWAAECSYARPLSKTIEGWVGYDRVYRYPALDETAGYQGFPLGDPLNENLAPETGDNFEVGIKFKDKAWNCSATGFLLKMDDEIAYDPSTFLNRNLNETRRLGVEAVAGWRKSHCGASTRWSFIDARFTDGPNEGNRVPLVPWAYGVFSAWLDVAKGIRLTATYDFVGAQVRGGDDANAESRMDPYGLLGVRMNAAASQRVDVFISIDNLTDEQYAETVFGNAYYPGAGRSFRVGMDVEL